MKNLKKLILNEMKISISKTTKTFTLDNKENVARIELDNDLFQYKKIVLKQTKSNRLKRIVFNVHKNCSNLLKNIYVDFKTIKNEVFNIDILFDENDSKSFIKLIYGALYLGFMINDAENYANISFHNKFTSDTKILNDVFKHFSKQPFNEISIEEIEEYIEDNSSKQEKVKNITLSKNEILTMIKNGHFKGGNLKLDETIKNDLDLSYWYAKDVIKGRFPEGEKIIITSAYFSYWYAIEVIKGRFPEGEATIATSARDSYTYARDVIQGRFPEGEAAIATDAQYSYYYARDVIQGRFPEGEAAIATKGEYSYNYAKDVIEERFPEGEKEIVKGRHRIDYNRKFGTKLKK